jgi:hypothetical protein
LKLQNAAIIAPTAKRVVGYLEEGLKRKSRSYLEKVNMDLEEEEAVEMQLRCLG